MKTQRDCLQPKAHSLQPGFHYHPSGWRVSKVTATSDTLYLYGPGGQLLSACAVVNGVRGTCSEPVYFAGRLLYDAQGNRALTDRLGTVRNGGKSYYPFGEEIGTPSANNTYKFASTYRDSNSGLDYALNRYYASGMGRFLNPDPYKASGGPASPQSWNRYSYVHGDPVNFIDPNGTNEAPAYGCQWNGETWACDWGVGGGGGGTWDDPGVGTNPLDPMELLRQVRDTTVLGDKVGAKSMAADPDCAGFLASTLRTVAPGLFNIAADNVIVDLVQAGISNLDVDSMGNYSTVALPADSNVLPWVTNVQQYFTSDPDSVAVTFIRTNSVFLANSYFGMSDSRRRATLIHETLHADLFGYTDEQLARASGWTADSGQSASAFFSNKIFEKCH
jgi:RHS repeat-associated protein